MLDSSQFVVHFDLEIFRYLRFLPHTPLPACVGHDFDSSTLNNLRYESMMTHVLTANEEVLQMSVA